ncbi:malto-oligosyltrehalose trehalohydrolase [Pedobacter deserti]|uniref:malto-oligosyltrehalose trehalohydrolase n=1 Tax=Pedobacter deserti TaxID=2817382 RepID=UPI00210EA845|nr:malto-oligosyltrehalose trehalohydrolase [Pedobacter sp. SYSU D00382]
MKQIDVLRRGLGVHFNAEGLAEVCLWAPKLKEISLVTGDKTLPLTPQSYGYWHLSTNALRPGDTYWFLADGQHRLADPASVCQPEGVHGPSLAVNLEDRQEGGDWKNPPLSEYIIYELHTGTFSPRGDFEGIAERLDHLKELGITAIELMPVAAFPGNRNWGYDGVFPFAAHSAYGGAEGLRELVARCHEKGIAVVLDVVYNHLGPEGNYLDQFGPFFTDKYHTPWGNAINFDDSGCDGVRHYFIENVLMWFRNFHIDALRLDAVHAIKDFGAVHILQEIRRYTDELMAQTGRKHYLIVESDLNDPRYISPLSENGLGMDAQWVDEFHHTLRVAAGEPKQGYYCDFNGAEHLAKSYRDAYVYTGMFSEERCKTFGREATGRDGSQFIVFSQNHDQVGNRMLGERSSELYSFEMQKLLAAAVMCSPFLPMLFMGEEWGEKNPFLYFVSHTDPDLVELVRKGRKEEFAAMHNGGEAPDPQAEETFERSRLNWDALREQGQAEMFRFYKELIALRKSHPLLRSTDRLAVDAEVLPGGSCLRLTRKAQGSNDVLICLMNFSAEVQHVKLPDTGAQLHKLIDSADPQWLGPAAAPEQAEGAAAVDLQPQSFIAYSTIHV